MRRLALLALLALLLPLLAAADSTDDRRVKLGAPGLSFVGLPPDRGEFFVDQLASQLESLGIRVITAQQITSLLGNARSKAVLGCGDEASTACLVELANAVGVDGLINGSLGRFGDSYQLNLVVVDARDGSMLGSFSGRADGEKALIELLGAAARELGPQVGRKLKKPVISFPRNALGFNLISAALNGFAELNLEYEHAFSEHWTLFVAPRFASQQGLLAVAVGVNAPAQVSLIGMGTGVRWFPFGAGAPGVFSAFGPAPVGPFLGGRIDEISHFRGASLGADTVVSVFNELGLGAEAGWSVSLFQLILLSASGGMGIGYGQGFDSTLIQKAQSGFPTYLLARINAGITF